MLRHYEWSLGIFLKLCFIHWKSHLKHVMLCVSAILKYRIEVNIPSYKQQINMCLTCQFCQVLPSVLSLCYWVNVWKQEEHDFIQVWVRWLYYGNPFFSSKPTISQKFFPWFLQVVGFFHAWSPLLSLLQKMNTFE